MIWKDIKDFDGYEVSDTGLVRNKITGYIMTNSITPDGYYKVTLRKNNKGYYPKVHRLVATAFIPNPNNLPEVNHKDENPTNNSVDNLEWCSHLYNVNYGTRNQRASNTMKGRKPVKAILVSAKNRTKKVFCVGLNKLFNSCHEAELITGIPYNSIKHAANPNNAQKYAGGYEWRYA